MATQAIVGAKTEQAHERALQVVREHAPEHAEALDATFGARPNGRDPLYVVSYQAGLIAALAELAEGQDRRIIEMEKASAASSKGGKKKA